jgi:hypothetical protein
LKENQSMASLDSFHKRLRNEIAVVEREIQSHNQQVETLGKRLEGLKRAIELFGSDQAAIAELLQTSMINGSAINEKMATVPAVTMQRTVARPKTTGVQKQPGRSAQVSQSSTKHAQTGTKAGNRNGGLSRVDMIAGVLKRHPRRTVRELIALLNKEYRWKTTESAVTRNLYTRRDKFMHTQPDRAANRLVTWSVK